MSEILKNWQRGLGLPGTLAIDGHTHLGDWQQPFTQYDSQTVESSVESIVRRMDANGVDAICALPTGHYTVGSDYRIGNDFVLGVRDALPERVIGFVSINPNDAEKAILSELDRMFDAGFRCVKLVNAYQENYPGDGPNLMRVYAYAAECEMLVLNHHWSLAELMRISEEFPTVDFICGHFHDYQIPVLKSRSNVHANIWTYGRYGWLDKGIKEVGAEKFMFGSDAFLNPMSVGIGPVAHAPVSDDDKRLILGLNCARLLEKVGALPKSLRHWIE